MAALQARRAEGQGLVQAVGPVEQVIEQAGECRRGRSRGRRRVEDRGSEGRQTGTYT